MGSVRYIILAVAAVVAIGLALLVRAMVGHPAPPPAPVVAQAKPMAQVLVAHRDLPIGNRLSPGDLAWQPWPVDALNPAYITDGQGAQSPPKTPSAQVERKVAGAAKAAQEVVTGGTGPMDALYGSIVREPILANEPITNAKLVRGGEGGYMAVVLRPGTRAIAVPVSVTTAAGGFILPGDHVDVLQSHQAQDGGNHLVTEVLERNVRVLAIDQTTKPAKNTPSIVGAVATLEVPAADAEVLARGKAQGDMILALRAYSDAGGPSGGGGLESTTNMVRIFRNGQSSDVTVTP